MAVHRPTIFIGLGSNLGQPLFQLKRALTRLRYHPAIKLLACSSVYETAPIGYDDQPAFMNAVAMISSTYRPHRLLDLLQSIESRQLRKRTSNQNSPRTLDLDILLYGQIRCETERLILPHPRLLERRFVLQPLLEISPTQSIPGKGFARAYLPAVLKQDCHRKARLLLN